MPTRVGRCLRAPWVILLSLVLASTLLATVPPPPAQAAVQRPFTAVYQSDQNGAISIVGNAQMSCPTAANGCATARAGSGANTNNNNYAMAFLDVDGVAGTTNSTTANLAMPAGSSVLHARLIWSARMTAGGSGVAGTGAPGTAKFRSPAQSAYSTITATTVVRPGIDTDPYQASLDVTATVQAGGNGTYYFADMVGATGSDRYAGWQLVVAYSNPSLPLRNLTVFEGFADITTESTANSSVSTTVSGFLTPANGTVTATVGLGAWEGDLGTSGDVLRFNGTTLSDSTRPSQNSFNSSISDLGVTNTARNPANTNNFGVDMGRVSANGVLPNGATSATVNVSTSGDYIYLGLITTEVDLYTPSFVGVSKTVTNLSGNSPAKVGDTLQYQLSYANSGQDSATNVVLRDPLPANLSYVPGSIVITSGANASTTPKTDATADDVAEYVAASRLVRVRLGTGANATSGGTVAPGGSTTVRFRATVDRTGAGTTITNGSFLDYTALTLGRNYTFTTNTVSTPVQDIADLAVTKSSTPTSQTAGSAVTYTVNVANNGPNAATNVVTTDTLPAGVSFTGAAPPTGTSCTNSGQTVTCTSASIASGTTVAIPITVDIAPGTAAGTLVNSASATAATADDVSTNNSGSASTTITRNADLALTKTGTATVAAGNRVSYTLTATNSGPSTATATTITDTLPVGATLVSTDPSQGTCTANTNQTIVCSLGSLGPSSTATVGIVATVAASFTGPSLVNSATVTSGTPDATAANNTASRTTTVTQNADIAVTAAATPDPVVAGNQLRYTLTVANNGSTDARDVSLRDQLPNGVTVLETSPTQGTCSTAPTVTCDLGLITPGTTARVTVLVRVDSSTDPGTLTNTASATTTTPQTNTGNDSGSVTVSVTSSADLGLTKTANPNPVQLGNNLTYTLTARNTGPSLARTVVLTDTLPAGTSFVSGTGCTAAGQTVTCAVGSVPVGDTVTRTITVSTPGSGVTSLTNTATVDAATGDPASANNTASFVSTTESSADLSLTKSTSPTPLVAGQNVSYTLTGTNRGPSAANGVSIVDTVPAPVNITSATASVGSCDVSGQTVTCTAASLAAAASMTVTIVGRYSATSQTTTSANTATISASTPTDPTASNNSATSASSVSRSADVSVLMTTAATPVRAGEEATYTVRVNNAGPSTAVNTVITGQVPEGLDPVLGSSGGACRVSGRTVVCEIGTLAVDSPLQFSFQARVRPSTPAGAISGTAFVGSQTPDADPDNNASTAVLNVTTAANLGLTKVVSPSDLVAGGPATYTLVGTNTGPSDATAVTLTDTLPAGLAITGVTTSTGTCSVAGQTVSCAVDRLAPSGLVSVRIAVDVAADATGSRTNAATITSEVTDPAPGNNSAAVTAPIVASADLRLSKSAAPDPLVAGNTVRYTFNAVNTGPSVATTVALNDSLPTNARVLAGSAQAPAGSSCTVDTTANTLSCALGNLAPGATQSVTVDAFVPSTVAAGTEVTNTATLTSPTPTNNPDGRTASVTSTVAVNADLGVTAVAVASSPIAGDQQTYLLTVTNSGPSLARSVTLVDTLPDALSFASAVNPNGTCTAASSRVSCSLGDLAAGATVVLRITADVDPRAAGQVAQNTVRVSSTTNDPNDANDTATVDTPIAGQTDLTLDKTVTSGPVVAGRPVTYRLELTNEGPSQARAATLIDVLPDRLGYSSATASDDGSCVYDELTQTPADDDEVRCGWDTVEVGETVTASLTFTVPVDYPIDETLTNVARASASSVDPTPAEATARNPVTSRADLSATKTLLSGPPTAGQEVRWQITVRNDGPSLARAVTVADPTPSGLRFTSAQTAQGSCSVASGGILCALGDLAVGGTAVVTVNGTLAADFTADSISNTATVGATTTDPDPDDNVAEISSAANASADLVVTKTAAPATLVAGEEVTWTVRLVNDGPSQARQVRLSDELPDGVNLVSRSLDGPGSCSTGRTVVCTIPTLASGAAATLTVVGRVASSYAGTTLANTAFASSAVADPDALDNRVVTTSPVIRSADLSVTQTGPATAAAGEQVSYQVSVRNDGPSDASGLVVIDDLPEDLLGITGTFPGGSCTLVAQSLECPVGVLTNGETFVLTITGVIDPGSAATLLTSSATIQSATPDPDTADLTAVLATTLTRSADLAVTKVANTEPLVAGQPASWTLTVRNAGPSVSRDVVVTDPVPDGVTITRVDPSGTCGVTGGVLECRLASIAPGTPARITVTGSLASGYAGDALVNTATVEAATPDPVTTNDLATSTTEVVRSADVAIAQSVDGAVIAGQPATLRLQVRNEGPSDADGVVVTDTLPGDVSNIVVTAVPPGASCAVVGQQVTCTFTQPLVSGTFAEIELTGLLDPDAADTLTNTAVVTASTTDPVLANNETTITGTAGVSADVAVSQTLPGPVTAGSPVTWTVTVSNGGGPSLARSLTLTDLIPADVTDVVVDAGAATCTTAGGPDGTEVSCGLGDLPVGEDRVITISGRVVPGSLAATLVATATVSSPTPDPSSVNNSARTTTELTAAADLRVTTTADTTTLVPGTDSVYTIVVRNLGPSTARQISLADTLPDGVQVRAAGPSTDNGRCFLTGRVVSCEVDQLAPDTEVAVTIPVRVDPSFAGTAITNRATATSATPDPVPANNADSTVSPASGRADLTLLKTGPDEVRAGTPLRWRLELSNDGPSDARETVVTDTLPVGLGTVDVSTTQGTCVQSGRTVTCTVGELGVGDTVLIDIATIGNLDPSYPVGPIVNAAEVSSPVADPDTDADDDTVPDGRSATTTTEVVREADVTVAKVPVTDTAVAGGPVAWTVTVSNSGPSTARGVVLEDPAVAGLTGFTVRPPAGVSCSEGACSIGDLLPGPENALTFAVEAEVPAAYPGSTVTNTATTSTTTRDPDAGDNRASSSVPVTTSGGVSLVKTGPATAVPGQRVSWVLTVTNSGPSLARGVRLTDVLPAGLSDIAVNAPPTVPCTEGSTVSCALGSLAAGAANAVTVRVSGLLAADFADGTLSNTATVTSTTPDPTVEDNADTATSTVTPTADLAVAKAGPTSVVAGRPISWTLRVTNPGPSLARDVVLVDDLPVGLLDVAAASAESGVSCSVTNDTVRCVLAALEPATSRTVTLSGRVDPAFGAVALTNVLTVESAAADPNLANNRSSVATSVNTSADLSIDKAVTPDPVAAGAAATFTLEVANAGPSVARGAVISDVIPDGMTIGTVTTTAGGCAVSGQRVTCAPGDLGPTGGSPLRITIPVQVADDFDPDGYANTATVLAETADPEGDNNASTVAGPTATVADLRLTKSADRGTAAPGEAVTYTLEATNDGPATARGVSLVDQLPAAFTVSTATVTGGSCAPVDARPLVCTVGDLRSDQTVRASITGTVDAGTSDAVLTNAAAITSPTTRDPEPGDNTDQVSTPLRGSADLSVSKTASPDPAVAGAAVTWRVSVTNAGPSVARSVVLADTLPDGVTVTSATLDLAGSDCRVAGNDVECDLPPLAPGQTGILTVAGRIAADYAASTVVNRAAVRSATTDPDPLDNSTELSSAVTTRADLSVTKTGPASIAAGETATWTATVRNDGPSDASGVVLTDALPVDLRSAAGRYPGGSCAVTGADLVCPVGVVGAGDQVAVTVTGQLDPASQVTTLTNTATVTAATADPDVVDRTGAVTTTVNRSADLSLTKIPDAEAFVPGQPAGWTITVVNTGPSVARSVRVTDPVPPGITGAAVTTSSGTCTIAAGALDCDLGVVAAGAPVQIRLTGDLDADYAGNDIANTATVSSSTPDADAADNTATATTDTAGSADLSVGKAITSGTPVAGSPITFRLLVDNLGPSDATGVVVTDSVPTSVRDLVAVPDQGSCTVAGQLVRCDLDVVPSGDDASIQITGVVTQRFSQTLTNTAEVSGDTVDPSSANNRGIAQGTVGESADLDLTKAAPETVVAGGAISWTLEVTNPGPSTARDVTLTDAIPAGVGAVRVTAPTGVVCSTVVTCTIGDLGPADSVVVTVSGTVDPDYAGEVLANAAEVSSRTADPSSINNRATSSTTVQRSADLVVSLATDPTTLVPGTDAAYTVRVRNDGSSTAQQVVLSQVLPEGIALRDDPTSDAGSCTVAAGTITCTIDRLDPGAVLTVTVPIRVPADLATSPVVTSARATSATPEARPADNVAALGSPLAAKANLTLDKSGPEEILAGRPLAWTITVTNDGPSAAQSVVVTDDLPEEAGPVEVDTSQGSCTQSGRQVTCALGTLTDGGRATISLRTVGVLDPSTPGQALLNAAVVTSPTPEPNPGTNDGRSDAVSTEVTSIADLVVTSAPDTAAVVAGGPVSWTVTVANAGPSTAFAVRLRNPQISGLAEFAIAPPAGVTCDPQGECLIGALAPGAENALTFTVSARVPAGFLPTTVTNVATVQGGPDPVQANNRTSSTVDVTKSAAIRVVKTGPATVTPGEPVSWTIAVTNDGPSTARGVEVADLVPGAVSITAPTGNSCAGTRDLRCTIGDLGAGRTAVIRVSGILDADFAGTTLTNAAQVTSGTPDPDQGDNTSTAVSAVAPRGGVSLVKSGPSTVVAGQAVRWTLEVANAGPSTARGLVLTDDVPDGVTNLTASGSGATCTVANGSVGCTLDDLAAGADTTVRIGGTVEPGYLGTLSNSASVTSTTADPEPGDNSSGPVLTTVTGRADLSLSKAVAPAEIEAGEPATFTLLVGNAGPSVAQDSVVTDVVPDGMAIGTVTSTAGRCQVTGQVVSCALGALAPTGSAPVRITIPVSVADDFDPAGYSNTASVLSATVDPDSGDNSDTVSGPTATDADLSVAITADRGTATAGGPIGWAITAANDGPSTARNTRVVHQVPAGVTVVSASVAGGSCLPLDARPLVCTVGDLGSGDEVTISVVGAVDPAASAPLTSSVAISSPSTADPDASNNTDQVTVPVSGAADLGVTVSATPNAIVAGQELTWTFTVTNRGPSLAREVQLRDVLPAGVTLLSSTLPGGSCSGVTTVTCVLATLAPDATATVTVVGRLDPAYAGSSVTNEGDVSSAVTDPEPRNDAATVTTPVLRRADVSVTHSGPATLVAGATGTWTITVTNDGPSDATGVVLTEQFSAALLGLTGTFPGGSCSGVPLRCTLGAVPAGTSVAVTVTGQLDPATTAATVTATATASAATPDPDSDDLAAATRTTVLTSADLSIVKQAVGTGFVAGDRASWTLTVLNDGPSVARNVLVTDQLPEGLDAPQVTGASGCAIDGGGLLTCEVAELTPGVPLRLQLSGTLAAGYDGDEVTNSATVDSATPDPDRTDNLSTALTPVGGSADLSLGKALTSGPVAAGAPISFALVVANAGPSAAEQVVVTDLVPNVVTDVAASTPAGDCTVIGQQVSCTIDELADGATATITVTGTVAQSFGGMVSNTASVTSATSDPDPANNSGTAEGSVGESADLSLTKTGPTTVVAGTTASWTLAIRNDGPSTAREVLLTDRLPAGLTDVRFNPNLRCTEDTLCNLGDLTPGAERTILVSGRLDPAYAGTSLVNSASVDSSTPDPDSTDTRGRVESVVSRSADLQLTKASDPEVLVPGTTAAYRLVLGNDGPSTATGVDITDPLPSGLTVAGTPTILAPAGVAAACDPAATLVACTVDALAPDGEVVLTIPVRVDAGLTGPSLTNTATATASTPDPDQQPARATVVSPVRGRADLTLTKTGPAEVVAGEPVTWQLVLTNSGPSDARDVVLTDDLPAGIGPVDVVADRGTCTRTGTTLTCPLGTVAAGDRVAVTVSTVEPLAPDSAAEELVNTATVTSPVADPDPGDGDRTARTTADVVRRADLAVSKTLTGAPPVAGGPVTWQITVVNNGPSAARNVVLADPGVAGLDDFTIDPPAGVACTDQGVCTTDSLLPGVDQALVFTATADVPADFDADDVRNTATVSSDTDDPVAGNNRATAPADLGRASDLSTSKIGPADVAPGELVSWTIAVTNDGPSQARGVSVTDSVPAAVGDVTVDSASLDCTLEDRVVCTTETLGVGATATVTVSGRLAADFEGNLLTNTAVASSTSFDADQADNRADSQTTVSPPRTAVSVTKTGPIEIAPGQPVNWVVSVANAGPSLARGVQLSDVLPAGSTDVEVAVPDGVVCTGESALTCAIAELAVDRPVTLRIRAVLDAGYVGPTLSNTASISAPGDTDPADDTSTTTTTVRPRADLTLTKTGPDEVQPGDPVAWTVEVTNHGPSVARSVVVNDVLPDGVGEVAADLGGDPAPCIVAGRSVSCVVGDLAPDATATVGLRGVLDPGYTGSSLANTASVTATTPDAAPEDNLDTAETAVGSPPAATADLVVDKRLTGAAVAGAPVVWAIDVRNGGEAVATDVRLTDPVPAGVRFPSDLLPAGCSLAVGTITCALGDLPAGRTSTVTLTGVLDARAFGALENTATVSSSAPEADPADNADTASAEAAGVADLAVTKTVDDTTVQTGDQVVYTVDVTNVGPSDALETRVIEDWPSGIDFRSATVTQGSFDADAMVWRVGTLVGGTSARLVLYGEVRSEGDLVNQVGVTAPGVADTVSPNNLAAVELRRVPGLAETGGPALGVGLIGLLLLGAGVLISVRARTEQRTRPSAGRST